MRLLHVHANRAPCEQDHLANNMFCLHCLDLEWRLPRRADLRLPLRLARTGADEVVGAASGGRKEVRWSSMRPACTRRMSEKKSSSGTVGADRELGTTGALGARCRVGMLLRWSSSRLPWHRTIMSKKSSSSTDPTDMR